VDDPAEADDLNLIRASRFLYTFSVSSEPLESRRTSQSNDSSVFTSGNGGRCRKMLPFQPKSVHGVALCANPSSVALETTSRLY